MGGKGGERGGGERWGGIEGGRKGGLYGNRGLG